MTPQETVENLRRIGNLDKAVRKALSVMGDDAKKGLWLEAVERIFADPDAGIDLIVMMIVTGRLNFQKYMDQDLARRNL